jgi:XisI protein
MDIQPPIINDADDPFDQWMADRRYRNIIIDVLQEVAQRPTALRASGNDGKVRTVTVFDESSNQYQILDLGWDDAGKRVFQPMIHLELLDGKIWIQENMTDLDIAKLLLEWDVEPTDIVLGMHSESLRQFSEYAIG